MSRSCATAALAGLLVACVDPAGRLDDFESRVIDAGERDLFDAAEVDEIPNATGTFLVALSTYLGPDQMFELIADVSVDVESDTFDITLQPLDVRQGTRDPVGDSFALSGAAISPTAEFEAQFVAAAEACNDEPPEAPIDIAGDANPLSGSPLRLAPTLHGRFLDEDTFCGTASGCEYSFSLDLGAASGSTFAAIRIDPDLSGEDLPEAFGSCAALPDDGEGNGDNGDNGNGDGENGNDDG